MLIGKLASVLVVVNKLSDMKKFRFILYLFVLLVLMFLYFGIFDSLLSASHLDPNGGAQVGIQLIGLFIAPLTLILGFVRLWLLRPLRDRFRLLDIPYFVIPILMIVGCFASEVWMGIILSAIAGVFVGYEFSRSIIKIDLMVVKKI